MPKLPSLLRRRLAHVFAIATLIIAGSVAAGKFNTMSSADVPAIFDGTRPTLSYELSDTPASLSPRARVVWWMRKNKAAIQNAEHRWGVDRRAIASAVAYEALENREPLASLILSRFAGPGKLHYKAERFGEGEPVTKEVEDRGYLPRRSVGTRKVYLETDAGSIEYIGAILSAFTDIAKSNGYSIACDVPMLGTFYTSWTLDEADRFFVRRRPAALRSNDAGTWMKTNLRLVERVVGTPSRSTCIR